MKQLAGTTNKPDRQTASDTNRLPTLVTESTLTTWLDVNRTTLWRWVSTGTFPRPFKASGSKSQNYWLAEEVSDWAKAKYRAAQQQAA